MRVAVDTNIWLSGLLWSDVPGQILELVENGEIDAIGSEEISDELLKTLSRPKFEKRLNQLRLDLDTVMLGVRQVMTIVPTIMIQVPNLRDPKDSIIIAAISGRAELIVTGDQDLLVLEEIAGIKILLPKDLLARH